MDVHERLKVLREQLSLTTRAFGEPINMTGGAITNMEKGRRNITERTIRDICQVYDVNPDWLISGEEPMFCDVVSNLPVNDDVKQLARLYSHLSDSDKILVKNLIDSLSEKSSDNHNPGNT